MEAALRDRVAGLVDRGHRAVGDGFHHRPEAGRCGLAILAYAHRQRFSSRRLAGDYVFSKFLF